MARRCHLQVSKEKHVSKARRALLAFRCDLWGSPSTVDPYDRRRRAERARMRMRHGGGFPALAGLVSGVHSKGPAKRPCSACTRARAPKRVRVRGYPPLDGLLFARRSTLLRGRRRGTRRRIRARTRVRAVGRAGAVRRTGERALGQTAPALVGRRRSRAALGASGASRGRRRLGGLLQPAQVLIGRGGSRRRSCFRS